MRIRRASVRLTALAGVALAATLVVPPPASSLPVGIVLSDVLSFRIARLATGQLSTSACWIASMGDPGKAPEPTKACVADVNGYPVGTAVVMVPNDPSEQIRFNFSVPPNGNITGPAVETEQLLGGAPVTYTGYYTGVARQFAPGQYLVTVRVYEPATAP